MSGQQGAAYEPGRLTHAFLGLCVLSCVLFLGWAMFFRLDIVSEAQGEVVPRTKVKRVQHLEGGIISSINVREGDRVSVGDPLVELDSIASDTSVEELAVRVQGLRADLARLEAESAGSEQPDFPHDLQQENPRLTQQAKELFEARQERVQDDLAEEDERILQREQDVREITARLRNRRESLRLLREQIAISEELLADKLTTKYKHLSFLKEESGLKSNIEEDQAALSRARSGLAAAREKRRQVLSAFREDVQEDLRKVRQQLLEYRQRMRKMRDSQMRTVIRSPEDGVVKSLYVVNEGEVVQPGVTILDIVPADDPLVVEAHLPVRDIGYVAVGQRAVVRLASADARRFGALEGEVVHVSPDALTLESGETFYRVRVATGADSFRRGGEQYRLFPGMRVIVGIHTGSRTVLEYLVDPFLGSLSRGLQER